MPTTRHLVYGYHFVITLLRNKLYDAADYPHSHAIPLTESLFLL